MSSEFLVHKTTLGDGEFHLLIVFEVRQATNGFTARGPLMAATSTLHHQD